MGWLVDGFAWLVDQENWSGPAGVPSLLVQHAGYTLASLGLACAVALPLALWLGHIGRGGVLAVQVSNIGRAVPTLAVLVILVLGPLGRSTLSAVLAFTLFAIPPVLTNAYVGMREVDRGAVEAARGMGMTGWQVLHRVELPLATGLVMNGVRLAAVQVVATVSIAALAAFGGLGRIVTAGFANQDVGQVVAGAFLIAGLAVAVEVGLARVARAVDPRQRVLRAGRRRETAAASSGAVPAEP